MTFLADSPSPQVSSSAEDLSVSRIRVTLLTRTLLQGGAERQLVTLAKALHSMGHRVVVMVMYQPSGPLFEELADAGVRVIAIGKRGRWDTVAVFLRARAVVRRERPQVLYSFLPTPNLLSLSLGALSRRPAVVWGVRATDLDPRDYDWFTRWTGRLEAKLARFVDLVICNSCAGATDANHRGFPTDRLCTVRNGVDSLAFRPSSAARREFRSTIGVRDSDVLVGLAARLHPMKGHDTFVRSAALLAPRFQEMTFVCIGSGDSRLGAELKVLAKSLGIAHRFRWVEHSVDIAAAYNAFDLACSASVSAEGCSNALIEAMACGTPCVTTDVGDSAFIVNDTGEVVHPNSPELFADAIQRLLERRNADPEVGNRARQRALDEFSVERMAASTVGLLARLVARYPVPVAHVINDLDVGGAEMTLVRLCERIDRARFPTTVISLGSPSPLSSRLETIGVPVLSLDLRGRPGSIANLRVVARELRRQQRPIVQTWLPHADLIGGLMGRVSGCPVAWNIRTGGVRVAFRPHTRFVIALNARLSRWIPSAIVCCSAESERVYGSWGYDSSRTRRVLNGVDVDRFRPDRVARESVRAELGLKPDTVLVGLIARWHPVKNHHGFVNAASRVAAVRKDVTFVLCGTAIDRANVALAEMLRVANISDRVVLLGPRDDIPRLTSALDVAVCASNSEGFPNVVAEAMACGVLCVSTDAGDARELLGGLGFVVPPDDTKLLADGILEALASSSDERRRLGDMARVRVTASYGIDRMVRNYEDLYEELSTWRDSHVWHRRRF